MEQQYSRKGMFYTKFLSTFIAVFCMVTGIFAQTYTNGNLSTGATSSNSVAAPAGYTWSEVQNPNTNAGFAASITATNFRVADNFTVTGTWALSTMVFYGYQTGYLGSTSPFTTIRVQIHSGSVTGPVVFGDLTTNRFASSADAGMYRIFNATPDQTRRIWSITANTPVSLPAGTYWVEWQTDVTGGGTHFLPPSTVVGQPTQPGNDGQQWTGAGWVPLVDGTNAQDMYFKVNYTTSACSGTPTPGNTLSTATSVCPTIPFTLSTQNSTPGSGVTYQWQSSATGVAGSFTNIAGATNPTYTTTLTATTYYQVVVTCSASSGTSTPVQVSLTPSSGCYCTPPTTDCTDGDIITNVTLGTLNNNSACGTNGYTNYSTNVAIPVPDLVQGAPTPIAVTAGGGLFTEFVGVWVDYNQNGTFETSEYVSLGSTTGGTLTGNLAVSPTATLGNTRMRVRVRYNTALTGPDACLGYTFGETEDYNVRIVPCTPATITTQPAPQTISCGGTATFTATVAGSAPSYLWEYRTSPTGVWLAVPNSAPFTGATSNSLTVSPVPVSFNGYEFRLVYSGACAGPTPSNSALLTVNPFTLPITPSVYNICSTGGTPALITIPNSSNTVTFTSNTVVNVPDASATGASSLINVTGIPIGATILKISVNFNMTHTYVGDMVINLKSPTATASTGILNLVGFLDNGLGGNSTANFTNTTVASDGVTAMSGFAAPRTGTFKADGLLITGGPTNGVANVTTWASLLSTPNANGNWGLYMADGGAGDLGVLQNWSITITYGAAPATAVFSPLTGLFTNAAATVPYTGTAVSQVYAFPSTTGANVYTATVSTATCTAAPQTITVNVNTPVTGTATVANKSVCAGSSATFSYTGLTGGPALSYQWQVSTSAVPAFTNIAGATSATYTVNAATAAQSGNQYRVIVTSAGCAAATAITSSAGTLTVNPIPVVVISASPNTVASPTSPVTLTAAVSSATSPITYQWYLNTVPVPGATGATFTPDVNAVGDYSVSVADANGCGTAASTPASITITRGASDIAFIYPSPNSGIFQVRFYNATATSVSTDNAMVNVYDEKGSRVYTQRYVVTGPYTQMNVDLGTHSKGIYRVEVTDGNGNRLRTGSVMVF